MRTSASAIFLFLAAGLLGGCGLRDKIEAVAALPDPRQDYVEIKDQSGRPLNCKVLAKQDAFVQVERQWDQKRFLLSLNSLEPSSGDRLRVLSDFNTPALTDDLFVLAKPNTSVELFYIYEACYFYCTTARRDLRTGAGAELDDFRASLKGLGVKFKETRIKPEKNKQGLAVLPPGNEARPYLKVGATVVQMRNAEAIKASIVDNYLAVNRGDGFGLGAGGG